MNWLGLGLLLIAVGVVMAIMGVPYAGVVVLLGAIAFIAGLFIRSGAIR